MSQLDFDREGYLVSYDSIETDWNLFISTLGWNDHRHVLIDSFLLFITELTGLSVGPFTIWIDGSFITKKGRPGDLDAVIILTANKYEAFEKELRRLRSQFNWLDVYFVKLIGAGKPNRFPYISDRTEWLFQFTMTKPDQITRRKSPKGFLQVWWNHE